MPNIVSRENGYELRAASDEQRAAAIAEQESTCDSLGSMPTIRISIEINAPLTVVWAAAADLESHKEWMIDAESIRFLTDHRRGLGTRLEVATRVGPLRTKDLMEVTEWVDHQRIGVRHTRLVTGRGLFELEPIDRASTRFSWREQLDFPWYLGGAVAGRLASLVLTAIWKRNLQRLKHRLEG